MNGLTNNSREITCRTHFMLRKDFWSRFVLLLFNFHARLFLHTTDVRSFIWVPRVCAFIMHIRDRKTQFIHKQISRSRFFIFFPRALLQIMINFPLWFISQINKAKLEKHEKKTFSPPKTTLKVLNSLCACFYRRLVLVERVERNRRVN